MDNVTIWGPALFVLSAFATLGVFTAVKAVWDDLPFIISITKKGDK